MYVSGCLGFELASGKIPGGAKEQTEAALNHMKNILLAAGTNMNNVVKTTIYLQNYGDFASVNEAYKEGKNGSNLILKLVNKEANFCS